MSGALLLRGTSVVAVVAGALGLAGCTTTQEKSAAIAAAAKGVAAVGSHDLGKPTRGIRLTDKRLLSGSDASAVVVELRNTTSKAIVQQPVGIRLAAGRQTVYTNLTDGLDEQLLHVPVILPGERLQWVNDQLPRTTGSERLSTELGAGRAVAPSRVPRLRVSGLKRGTDAGQTTVSGTVRNDSRTVQTQVVVFVTARRAGRVVAAGTSEIARLTAGSKASFVAYLIGKPGRAALQATAPPTVLQP